MEWWPWFWSSSGRKREKVNSPIGKIICNRKSKSLRPFDGKLKHGACEGRDKLSDVLSRDC